MKTVVNAIFLLGLLAGSVLIKAAPELEANRHLLSSAKASTSATSESNSQTGHASASASANSVGGVSTARAFASTTVLTEVTNIIIKAYQALLINSGGKTCEQLIAESELEVAAEAEAIASVYATTFGEVSVEGEGEACIDAYASGEAEAKAFALAVARSIVDQKFETVARNREARALADALVKVISAGTATAFAEAYASGCTTGGYGIAEQHSFAEAIIAPVARAYALAIGGSACLGGTTSTAIVDGSSTAQETVEASSETFTDASGNTQIEAGGDATASTEKVEDEEDIGQIVIEALDRCRGVHSPCCRMKNMKSDACDCSRSILFPRPQCNMKKFHLYGDHTIWEDMDSDTSYLCRC